MNTKAPALRSGKLGPFLCGFRGCWAGVGIAPGCAGFPAPGLGVVAARRMPAGAPRRPQERLKPLGRVTPILEHKSRLERVIARLKAIRHFRQKKSPAISDRVLCYPLFARSASTSTGNSMMAIRIIMRWSPSCRIAPAHSALYFHRCKTL